VRAIAARYPGDPGVVVALLMNYIVLGRGEAIFLRAGLVHAYISGLGVEIMAASDNVLRGGLTPKHIDVAELLSVLDTTPAKVPVLSPSPGAVTDYPVDVSDFALRRVTLAGEPLTLGVSGPAMVLATGGEITVAGMDREPLGIPVGTAAFATGETALVLSGTGEAFIAQPGPADRHARDAQLLSPA
jgi:mannose-6-phosphate isomerase